MAAGLGFKTFTTGEVLTAADTNGYLMQGILVFASAAARDAAITSPQEGQCCYLKDTDAVLTYSGAAWVGFDDSNAIQNTIVDAKGDIVAASASDTPARLAVGANGLNLFADSTAGTGLKWDIPSGMTLLSTTTLSGATTTISSISQSYKTLIAVITGVTNATGDGTFRININSGGSNNFYGGTKFLQGTGVGTYGSGYELAVAGDANLLRTSAANAFVFTLTNYAVANIKTWNYYGAFIQTAGGQYTFNSSGYNNDATATASLIFSNGGGNLSTGTVKLYGVN